MKFGDSPLDSSAEGAVLVHSLRADGITYRKGRILTPEDITNLNNAGLTEAILARLETDDVSENTAAQRMADAAVADKSVSLGAVGTGRVNVYSAAHGIFVTPQEGVDAVNAIDESITLSTIPRYEAVDPGQLIATVKIIPFAVSKSVLKDCEITALSSKGLFRVAPYKMKKVGLLQTVLAEHRPNLITKGSEVTAGRLGTMGLSLAEDHVCKHNVSSIKSNLKELLHRGCDIVLVLGAAASADRRDVLPSAIEDLGGRILQLGMPVDPGNLTFLASIKNTYIVGLPGSARSPRLHGSDWIIQRIVADLEITAKDIRNMGVGGLLKEIPGRPMPRTKASPPKVATNQTPPNVTCIVLAAGQSKRMGNQNKLLAEIDGLAMITHTVDAIAASSVCSINVVLGYEAESIKKALVGRSVNFIENSDYAEGLSTSLKRGVTTLSPETDAALICLGDMPRITPIEIEKLIAGFASNQSDLICVPTHKGKRGNPVLIGRRFFTEIQDIRGDVGARALIGAYPDLVREIEMDNDGVLLDIDTPEALAKFKG